MPFESTEPDDNATGITVTTAALNKALAAVQAHLPSIAKGATATIPGKDGRQGYSYDYADLADVSDAILPLLGKNGLAFTAWPTLDDGRFVLAYALIHESGEQRTGIYPLPAQGRPQDIGGVITYARRYALCAVTGVAPGGEDNDAAGAPEVHMDRPRRDEEHNRPPRPVPRSATDRTNGSRVHDGTRETPWDTPLGTSTPAGRTATIDAHFKRLGVEDAGVQNGYIATLIGHAVTKRSELAEAEQLQLLDDLARCRNRQALDRKRDERAGQAVGT